MARGLRCLQDRVFFEARARFLNRRRIAFVRQIADNELPAEHGGKFSSFVRIAGRKEKRMHVDRIYRINWIRISRTVPEHQSCYPL